AVNQLPPLRAPRNPPLAEGSSALPGESPPPAPQRESVPSAQLEALGRPQGPPPPRELVQEASR
ncbi:hypothetical protein GNI_209070, partial [Gregarina niphandrodes]